MTDVERTILTNQNGIIEVLDLLVDNSFSTDKYPILRGSIDKLFKQLRTSTNDILNANNTRSVTNAVTDQQPLGAYWICVSHELYENGYLYDDKFMCSNCHSIDDDGDTEYECYCSKYCPNCGCRMSTKVSVPKYNEITKVVIDGYDHLYKIFTSDKDGINGFEFEASCIEQLTHRWVRYCYDNNRINCDILYIERKR